MHAWGLSSAIKDELGGGELVVTKHGKMTVALGVASQYYLYREMERVTCSKIQHRSMTSSTKVHDTLVYRLSQVLTKLNQGESLDPQALADEFGVNLRTIQRDLNVRFACLPLIKTAGRYRLEAAHLGKLTIKDISRFASLSGVSGLFPQLSEQFLRGVFDSDRKDAWVVKGHHYEDLRGKDALFSALEQAIFEHHHVQFTYNKAPGQSSYTNRWSPTS